MSKIVILIFVTVLSIVLCKPLDSENDADGHVLGEHKHSLRKRFINPGLTLGLGGGGFSNNGLSKIRTRRNAEDCEKLRICKLHASAPRSFISTFELYFVNKENAKLWDHRYHSMGDCERRFPCGDYF